MIKAMTIDRTKKKNPNAVLAAIAGDLKDIGDEIKKDFEATTKTWKTKPDFILEVKKGQTGIRLKVYTKNEIYRFVSRGTSPHVITPKNAGGFLRFRSGYQRKSVPRVIGSRGNGRSGDVVYTESVNHPGAEAAEFEEAIAEKWTQEFRKSSSGMILRALRQGGFSPR